MDDYDKIRFGALLHDVGKFGYRTYQKLDHEKLGENINQLFVPEEIGNELIGLIHPETTKGFSQVVNFIHVGDMLASAERTKLLSEEIKEQNEEGTRNV